MRNSILAIVLTLASTSALAWGGKLPHVPVTSGQTVNVGASTVTPGSFVIPHHSDPRYLSSSNHFGVVNGHMWLPSCGDQILMIPQSNRHPCYPGMECFEPQIVPVAVVLPPIEKPIEPKEIEVVPPVAPVTSENG